MIDELADAMAKSLEVALVALLAVVSLAWLCLKIEALGVFETIRSALRRMSAFQRFAAAAFLAVFIVFASEKTNSPPANVPPPVLPPVPALPQEPPRSGTPEVTNLCFTGISISSNGMAHLSLAWPTNTLFAGDIVDLFATTSLVGTAWGWIAEHRLAADTETNWTEIVDTSAVAGVSRPPAMFFSASVRVAPDDLRDTDGDTIPDAYEVHNGSNPYVPDYALVPKLAVGPSGMYADISSALDASTAYSIIELAAADMHAVGYMGVRMPQHPVMVCAPPGPPAVIRTTRLTAFLLDSSTTPHTHFRNLYVLLDATSGSQAGFWVGGDLPWNPIAASATFEDIYVRAPNPGVEYFGWLLYTFAEDPLSLSRCTVNAAGSEWVYGVQDFGTAPVVLDRCSFVNFPPNGAKTSCGILTRSSSNAGGGAEVSVSRTVFDESFTDAIMVGRLENGTSNILSVADCIVPRELPPVFPLESVSGIVVTNAALSWAGFPLPDSPSVALGMGALSPLANDPAADMDGDGLSDYNEVYELGTDLYLADTDRDGVADGDEIGQGTDPADPHSFLQNLTATVTNTASLSHAAYLAWGYNEVGWEANELVVFPTGAGSNLYVNASSNGAEYVKAFCDLDDDGEFSAATDILLVRHIPPGAVAHIDLVFGDVDGDGVSDEQERSDRTDPYDAKSLRIRRSLEVSNSDFGLGVTNILAVTQGPSHWESDCIVTSFTGYGVSYELDVKVTNRYAYIKCLRDFTGDGDIGNSTNVLYTVNLGRSLSDDLKYTFLVGDSDSDGVPDSEEIAEGTNSRDGAMYCLDLCATILRIFVPSNGLSAVAYFGAETNILYGPCAQGNSVLTVDFGHLSTTTREKVTFRFWEDIDGNGILDAGERQSVLTLPAVGHSMCVTNMMPLGDFDADGDGMPDDWEVLYSLSPTNAADAAGDADGDGFMNLHEYWAGTDPTDATDDGNGTALYAVTHAVDDRIADKTGNVTLAKQIYVEYNKYEFNTNLVRNADCWIADIDVTCSSIWNDDPSYHYGDCATLITSQHVVLANHLNSPIGRGYIFRATNGTTTVRRLVDKLRIGSTDITVGLLESPLPVEYAPAKLLPPDYERYLGTGRLVPVCHQNQQRRVFVVELPEISSWRTCDEIWTLPGSTTQRGAFFQQVIGHDSGNPCCMLVGDQRILLYATHIRQYANGAPGGPHTALFAREIQSAIDTMSDRAGMTRSKLSLFDFSGYVE